MPSLVGGGQVRLLRWVTDEKPEGAVPLKRARGLGRSDRRATRAKHPLPQLLKEQKTPATPPPRASAPVLPAHLAKAREAGRLGGGGGGSGALPAAAGGSGAAGAAAAAAADGSLGAPDMASLLAMHPMVNGACTPRGQPALPRGARAAPRLTAEGQFICPFEGCGKVFKDAGALRKHSHTHGKKNFVCHFEGCGRRFVDASKLKRHFLMHTGERRYRCPFVGCEKAFSLDFNLRSHMKSMHKREIAANPGILKMKLEPNLDPFLHVLADDERPGAA